MIVDPISVSTIAFFDILYKEVDLSDYQNYTEAYQQIQQFLEDVYMHKRIHSALGYLTPVEFEAQFNAGATDDAEHVH